MSKQKKPNDLVIGRNIRLARWLRHLSQGTLCRLTGINRNFISKYENGHLEVGLDHLMIIMNTLILPLEFFEGNKEIQNKIIQEQERQYKQYRRKFIKAKHED